MRKVVRALVVVCVLALYYVMSLSAAVRQSMTFDEMAHLTGGYTYWAFNDYRLHPENGNWPQRLAALPAVISGAGFPSLAQPAWTGSNVYAIGDQFLYFSGNDAGTLLTRARAVMALVGVAVGALVYAWARRLVSPAGAWLGLVLFAFGPTFLAHGPLATSDMTVAFFFTAAVGAIWGMLHRVTPWRVLGCGVLIAGCVLSKFSGLIIVPIVLVMLGVRLAGTAPLIVAIRTGAQELRGRLLQAAWLVGAVLVAGLVAWGLLWASFGFRYTAFAAATTGADAFLGAVKDLPGIGGTVVSIARRFHLLPEAYLYGLGLTLEFAAERAAFLNGQYSTGGWWWYFPYAFAVKTTIPALILGGLALAGMGRAPLGDETGRSRLERSRAWLYDRTPLLTLVIVYGVFALTSRLNIGHRHLLPIYPALCILTGGAAAWIAPMFESRTVAVPTARRRRGRARAERDTARASRWSMLGVAALGLLAWHTGESLAIRPHYLAYFNQLAGGPAQGYKHLADSSLDWGQDLPALEQWLKREGLQPPGAVNVYLSYFGTARPEYYGIQATPLAGFIDRRPPQPPVPLSGGVYCVSATVLDVLSHAFYKPEYEDNYQAARTNAVIFARTSFDPEARTALLQQTGPAYWDQLFAQLDQLRTGRLAAYLRRRQPDAMVGYSILIYRLTDADVEQALEGPVPAGAS